MLESLSFSSDVVFQGSASPRGCLEADFYCLCLGVGLEGWCLGLGLSLARCNTVKVNHCNTNTKSKVHLEFPTYFQAIISLTFISAINCDNCKDTKLFADTERSNFLRPPFFRLIMLQLHQCLQLFRTSFLTEQHYNVPTPFKDLRLCAWKADVPKMQHATLFCNCSW